MEKVIKYCGAGIAAVGMVGPIKAHAVADLDTPPMKASGGCATAS